MKKYILGVFLFLFGLSSSVGAFSLIAEQKYGVGSTTEGGIFYDRFGYKQFWYQSSSMVSHDYTAWHTSTPWVNEYFHGYWDGGLLFGYILSSNGNWGFRSSIDASNVSRIGSIDYDFGLYNNLNTLSWSSYINDRDAIRVFTTGSVRDDVGTFKSELPLYDTTMWATDSSVNIYKVGTEGPVITNPLNNVHSHWWTPGLGYSIVRCNERGDNYCTSPTFMTQYYMNGVSSDVFLNNQSYKEVPFYLTTFILNGSWKDRDTRPYTFLGTLSGNAIEFSVYSCYFPDINNLKNCDVLSHGITEDIFSMNYSLLTPNARIGDQTMTGGFLGQALFGNKSPYYGFTEPSTSLGNYFSRIDFLNGKLYVASADIYGVSEQNAIGYTELDKTTNIADYFTGSTSGTDGTVIPSGETMNRIHSCAGHFNDPNYPGCVLTVVASGQEYMYSPIAPGEAKNKLLRALTDKDFASMENLLCGDPIYYQLNQLVCDNIVRALENEVVNIYSAGYSSNIQPVLSRCPVQFVVGGTGWDDISLSNLPFVGDFLSKSKWDIGIFRPFTCVINGVNYANYLSEIEDFGITLSGQSLIPKQQAAQEKRDLFMNLLFSLPALYLIFRKWMF